MATEIILPKVGNTVEECLMGEWHKGVGDAVKKNELLCEVETDKSSAEIVSTENGILRHVFYATGDVVKVMRVIAIVGTADEDIDALINTDEVVKGANGVSPPGDTRASADKERVEPIPAEDISAIVDGGSVPSSPFACTPRAKTYLRRKGLTVRQFLRYFPITSFLRHRRSITERAAVEETIIEEKDARAFFAQLSPISPLARKALIAQDVLLSITKGSGVGGRILARDIRLLSSRPPRATSTERKAISGMEDVREKKRTPIKGIRKIIAHRMLHSLQSTAQVTLTMRTDANRLKELRATYKEKALPITMHDIIMHAVSKVLKDRPWANSLLVEDTIIEYNDVNLGYALQTEQGLMVPVVASAAEKSLRDISSEIKTLTRKCKEGSISPNELQGGTFTVSNMGALGVEWFTPILNAPQTGILGIGAIEMRAMETRKGSIVLYPSLHLSLTFDHRAYDGANGALLLQACADAIANL